MIAVSLTSLALLLTAAAVDPVAPAGQAPSTSADQKDRDPKRAFARLEAHAAATEQRKLLLKELASAAFDVGEPDKARRYANELLASSDEKRWDHGNAVHVGHIVLGRLALREGDVAAAKKELLLAGQTPGSPQLNSFGPNMLLAKDLLERGERKVVLDFFLLCANFWKSGREKGILTSWAETVQRGEIPAFGSHLSYGWWNPSRLSFETKLPPPLTDAEKATLNAIWAEVRERARREFLALWGDVKKTPGADLDTATLEKEIGEALPKEELLAAYREHRAAAPESPRIQTPARRWVALQEALGREIVTELSRRVPPDRVTMYVGEAVRLRYPPSMRPPERKGESANGQP